MSFQARNRAGLWSEIVSSEKAVIADLAPPEIIEFNADRFINLDRRVSSTGRLLILKLVLQPIVIN